MVLKVEILNSPKISNREPLGHILILLDQAYIYKLLVLGLIEQYSTQHSLEFKSSKISGPLRHIQVTEKNFRL